MEITFIVQNEIVPFPKVVAVIYAGNGTLDNVDIQGAPSWLTIVRGGSGNTQTLTNSIDPSGLSTGIHNATITVLGGGPSNSENYTVTLNVAQNVLAPSKLNATAHSSTATQLTWTDNSDNENGFAIERKVASEGWPHLVSVAPNGTSYIDSPLTSQTMYHYRVRAFIEEDSSGWSNEESLELALVKFITLLTPAKDEMWEIGTTQHITIMSSIWIIGVSNSLQYLM
jgi:hypothetical protein